ncbi:MAG: ABC transporter permease subunit [Pirellulales bacterium]|nr:ABC transporter permease subunit [Pirellulales bacterium]
MSWSNVRLIFCREVRDQLRDRRTLFMIAVLPLLLYPLLGMSLLQLLQFVRQRPTRVLILGAEELPDEPPLIENGRFARDLFAGDPAERTAASQLLRVELASAPSVPTAVQAQRALAEGTAHVVVCFPPGFGKRLAAMRERLAASCPVEEPSRREPALPQQAAAAGRAPSSQSRSARDGAETPQPSAVSRARIAGDAAAPPEERASADAAAVGTNTAHRASPAQAAAPSSAATLPEAGELPRFEIYYNTADDKSTLTYEVRLAPVLQAWREEVARRNLAARQLPAQAVRPFEISEHDVAPPAHRSAGMWANLLPFLLLIWALTGAFYPAIDLCAGEKERGTLETLLSSPAQRSEIVWGKLCTVMLFSVFTALLNVLSIGLTGSLLMSYLPHVGPPPPLTPLWLALALLPMSALFSALCLALAAFARSTKEGQYYLMPLVMVIMPLMILPLAPSVELNLGNSLIPVTGVVLLLHALLQGSYLEALRYLAPVVGVTTACCLLAVRWAIDQFNRESVLFRESERLHLGLWFRQLLRDRHDTPSAPAAVFCGVLILILQFYVSLHLPTPQSFGEFARAAVVIQLAVVATPPLLMTVMLTRSPRSTLLLRLPHPACLPAAVLLAVALHPVVMRLNVVVTELYDLDDRLAASLGHYVSQAPSPWHLLLVLALLPAICEELAFRGFILSGLRHLGHKWWAIAAASFFFGVSHGLFQQSLVAALVGLVIGYLAVQSGSLLPAVCYHAVHNGLALFSSELAARAAEAPLLGWLVSRTPGGSCVYNWPTVLAGFLAGCVLLAWLHRLPYARTEEEQLQEAIAQHIGPGTPCHS